MRCECCDKILSDSEATSRFAESGTYTNMCKSCQGTLPKEIRIITRADLEKEELVDEGYKFEEGEDDADEE